MYSVLLCSAGAMIGYVCCKMAHADGEQKFNFIVMPSRKALIIGTCAFIGLVAGAGIDTYRFVHQ